MDRDSFVFYRDWYLLATGCDEQTQLKIYRAIMEYAFLDIEPTDPALQLAFPLIRQQMDKNKEKYATKCQKNREIAQKRWEAYRSMRTHTDGCERIGTDANDTDNDNVNDNENGYQVTNVTMGKEKTSYEVKKTATDVATHAQELFEVRKKKFYNSLVPYVETYGKKMIREFYDYWTEPNKSGTKFRQELERTWSLERRLSTWAQREQVTGCKTSTASSPKPYVVEGIMTPEQIKQEKDAKWKKEHDRLASLVEAAKNNPTSSVAQMVQQYREAGTLAKYGLE